MQRIFLILGDLIALYAALFLALIARYGGEFYGKFTAQHFIPFSIIFAVWLSVFYIAGLYDAKRLRNNIEFFKTLLMSVAANAVLSILFFYLIPYFGITPRTNLFIFIAIFAAIEIIWRRFFNKITASSSKIKVALAGLGKAAEEIAAFIVENPQMGYKLAIRLKDKKDFFSLNTDEISIIVVPRSFKNEPGTAKILYRFLPMGVEIIDLPAFYETIFRKIPLDEINEGWFLEEIMGKQKIYGGAKRIAESALALALFIILLPLEVLIMILVKLSSRGPAIYSQTRVGKNNTKFTLYKLRTMRQDAEASGPKWAETNDKRATLVGKILRRSHLDELPQLLNIIKGDLSFVGPRPERPEFVSVLKEKIPYYEMRHLVKPGVTGWAQINYRYGASEEDAAEKLRYDLYYLKNRSLVLDLAILLKTLKLFFINQK